MESKFMIPFNNFKRHYMQIKEDIDAATARVYNSGWFLMGPELEAFEKEFAVFTGTKYCIGCNSGTDALFLSLKALGIGAGDEVITTSVTAFPTITAIQMTGATPVVVDVFMTDGLIDSTQVELAVTSKTRAIIPVHLYGKCCDMEALLKISVARKIPIIEDCAQAAGAAWKGTSAGTMGAVGCFSFYPTKNLGAFGDAGAVCTSDPSLVAELRCLRNYGQIDRYHHETFGVNSRLDEIQAAILRAKLPNLDTWNSRRRTIAQLYREAIPSQYLLDEDTICTHVYHLFPILVDNRYTFMAKLNEHGVASLVHYPLPVFEQMSYDGRNLECPNAEAFCSQVVSLPIFPELTLDEVEFVARTVKSVLENL